MELQLELRYSASLHCHLFFRIGVKGPKIAEDAYHFPFAIFTLVRFRSIAYHKFLHLTEIPNLAIESKATIAPGIIRLSYISHLFYFLWHS